MKKPKRPRPEPGPTTLAREMHGASNTFHAGRPPRLKWSDLTERDKKRYEGVARILLAKYDITPKELQQG